MSRKLFAGIKPGYGPVLKIMADASYDPLTTPNTDRHKFRFNSEDESIAYTLGRGRFTISPEFGWDDIPESGGSVVVNYPPGSSNAACERVLRATGRTTSPRRTWTVFRISFDRGHYAELGYTPIMIWSRDRSDWTENWECKRAVYGGSTDQYYMSRYFNPVEMTTLASSISPALNEYGLVIRYTNPVYSHPYDFIVGVPAWFGPTGLPVSIPGVGNSLREFEARNEFPAEMSDPVIATELPIENDPYPAVEATFTADQPCLQLTPAIARMAKPGFNVKTTTHDKMIFSETKFPLKCVKSGSFTLSPSGTTSINIDYPLSTRAWVEEQINITGQPLRLPPYPNNNTQDIVVQHRIVGQQLQYRNQSAVSVDVRFFVMSGGDDPTSVGTAPVWEVDGDVITIRRPGTAGTSESDILVDSRATMLPIVTQGWVSGAQLTATPSDVSRYGTRMHVVNFSNPGSAFKPLVMAMAKYSRGDGHIWQSFFAKNIEISSTMSASTFMAEVTDTQVKFYFYPGIDAGTGTRWEDNARLEGNQFMNWPEQMTLVGFRYYVFAVPPTV